MSVDLGTAHWKVVGVVDGRALVTSWILQTSRWIDVRTWPGTLGPARDEWTRAVAPGAALVGWKTQTVYVDHGTRRRELKLPVKKYGYRAIGVIGGKAVVVPGYLAEANRSPPLAVAQAPMIHDGEWRKLAGDAGTDSTVSAVVGDYVIWCGRVHFFDGGLVPIAELRGATTFVASDGGFVTAAGGKLVVFAGKQREERAVGKLAIETVARYEDRLLLGDGRHYYLYDLDARTHERLDLGVPEDPRDLVVAPCGLLALVDQNRRLMRFR